jgi:hypothetical protein
MIAQSFDLFGTADAPVATNTKRTPHQAMLFAGELFAHVDPAAKPAKPVALDPDLHGDTIDEALAAADTLTDAELADAFVAEQGSDHRFDLIDVASGNRPATRAAARAELAAIDAKLDQLRAIALARGFDPNRGERGPAAPPAPTFADRLAAGDPDAIAAHRAGAAPRPATPRELRAAGRAQMRATMARLEQAAAEDPRADEDALGYTAAELAALPDAVDAPAPPQARAVPALAAGTRRHPDGSYTGVLRHGRAVVAECGHTHPNRDMIGTYGGRSARDCATQILDGAHLEAVAAHHAERRRDGWARLPSTNFTATTVAAAKAHCAADAHAYLAAVSAVRARLNLTQPDG